MEGNISQDLSKKDFSKTQKMVFSEN